LSAFGIRVAGNGEPDEFYVGNDDVLMEWLLAEDYEADITNPSNLIVTAPAGYLFHDGFLTPEHALAKNAETGKTTFIYKDFALLAKTYALGAVLRRVEPVQFYSLGFDKSRITDVVRPMEVFGIRVTELGDEAEHFIGYDGSLFDWLVADNYEPCDTEGCYRVKAPEGYVFLFGVLHPFHEEDGGDDFEYVKVVSPQTDKALMLLETMEFVEPAEFYARGIDDDRILDFLLSEKF
jgi:hypothetical protein